MTWDDGQFGIQVAAGLALVPILLWQYWEFRWDFYEFAIDYLGLVLILVLLYLLVYAQLGTGLGIHYLFWHEDFWPRVFAAMGATLLLGVLGVCAYYLDRFPWETDRKTADRLAAVDGSRRAVADRLLRRPAPGPIGPAPGRNDRWKLGLNATIDALFDPISFTPLQARLDPLRENSLRLQRFLRTARNPFLLLLLAPAVLPRFFHEVPRAAPTGGIGLGPEPPILDVTRSVPGYLLGLFAWWLGIALGVLAIKGFLRASSFFYRPNPAGLAAPPEGLVPDEHRDWVLQDRACPNAANPPGTCAGPGCPRGVRGAGPPPARCRADRQLRAAAGVFVGLFLMTYVAMGTYRYAHERGYLDGVPGLRHQDFTPAFSICAALGIVAMAYAVVAYQPKFARPVAVVGLVAWLGLANHDPFKLRFERMDYGRPGRVALRSRTDEVYFADPVEGKVDHAGLVVNREALEHWRALAREGEPDVVAGRPKLVLVAVSGGAARSAYWTAVVLDRLERALPGFGRRVRVISGASGGMLGTACYVTYRRDVAGGRAERLGAAEPRGDAPARPSDWVAAVPLNSMDPLARYIALSEIWKSLWPWNQAEDRGVILERNWKGLRYPLKELAGLERAGRIPSLIVSPMMVDDGRRLLISNLDLFWDEDGRGKGRQLPLLLTEGLQIAYGDTTSPLGTYPHGYSLSGVEFFRMFPRAEGFLLSTAVRMNASFPYVSPAVNLPSEPPRRVVDAGYYDNYGIQVATAWIQRDREWLAEHTSGVLLVQVRDSSSVKDRLDFDDAPPSNWADVTRGFQFLTSPIDGFRKARYTVASFRNDADVNTMDEWSGDFLRGKVDEPDSFFTTAIFENSAEVVLHSGDFWDELTRLDREDLDAKEALRRGGEAGASARKRADRDDSREVALTWYLTRAERQATERAIPDDPKPRTRWAEVASRHEMRRKLAGQVFNMWVQSPGEHLSEDQAEAYRRDGKLCFPPGPERDIRLKRLEQLRNYERIENLKKWWRASGRREVARRPPLAGEPPPPAARADD